MEIKIEIDNEKCISCGNCVATCPSKVFLMDDQQPEVKYPKVCIECTHCIATCPTDAVSISGYPLNSFSKLKESTISYDMFKNFLFSRRSIRNYKDKKIEREKLEKLLDAMKTSPTGENAQELRYLVIQDDLILDEIRKKMHKKFRFAHKLIKNSVMRFFLRLFIGKEEAERLNQSLERMMERYQNGGDPYLRGSPALCIIHCSQKTPMSILDAGISGHQLNLVAKTLGLGACWLGFHVVFSKYFRSVKKASKIPKGHKVLATLALGYSSINFRKICQRKDLNIDFIL